MSLAERYGTGPWTLRCPRAAPRWRAPGVGAEAVVVRLCGEEEEVLDGDIALDSIMGALTELYYLVLDANAQPHVLDHRLQECARSW